MPSKTLDAINEKLKRMPSESQEQVLRYINDLEMESATTGSGLESLWNEIDEIVATVSEEAWDEVPTDGASNHDHYLYGAPKRHR